MLSTDADAPLTMTVEEAGRRLGIGRPQAYEAVRKGEIPAIRIGKRLLVPVAAFQRMLEPSGPPPEFKYRRKGRR